MHLSINVDGVEYDGNDFFTYQATLIRSDNISNSLSYDGSIEVGQGANPYFENGSNAELYARMASDCYAAYCANFSLTPDPVRYVFLGLGVWGPFTLEAALTPSA
jgi:hypothetical protein